MRNRGDADAGWGRTKHRLRFLYASLPLLLYHEIKKKVLHEELRHNALECHLAPSIVAPFQNSKTHVLGVSTSSCLLTCARAS